MPATTRTTSTKAAGDDCADCHTDKNWKDTRFDHSKTHFPLTGKHVDVPCKDCHSDPSFKGASVKCIACHKKDDDRKGHKGRFGDKCETCHSDRDWKAIRFDHDRATKYVLKGKHRLAKCTACHTGILYKEKFQTACIACHKKDDEREGHKGKFGDKCESCHVEKDWGISIFDHDKQTKYHCSASTHKPNARPATPVPGLKKTKTDCYNAAEGRRT